MKNSVVENGDRDLTKPLDKTVLFITLYLIHFFVGPKKHFFLGSKIVLNPI